MKRVAVVAGALAALAVAGQAGAAEGGRRMLLAVGANVGLGDEAPLVHAVDDARRVAVLFRELGGIAPGEAEVLTDPTAAAVLAAVGGLAARAAGAEILFVYVSGHGDDDSLHLAGARLPLHELQQAVAALPMPLKVMVIDACRSPGIREKGLVRGSSFAVSLPPAPGRHEGLVTVLASGRGEAAQESARLGGGVFTHYLLSALRGAADRDGDRRVTLAEAYDFAYARTLARSVAAAGAAQRPELVLRLTGSGPLVVTQLDPSRSRLVLPAGADARYFVYAKGSSALVAEAWGRPDGPTTLALPAGRFVVQRQQGGAYGATEVGLPFEGEVSLAASGFAAVAPERLLARGGEIEMRPHTLAVAGGASGDGNLNVGPAVAAWYGRAIGALVIQAGLGLGALDYSTAYNAVESRRFDAAVGVGRQWAGPRVTAYALGDLALRLDQQRLRDLRVATAMPDWTPTPVEDRALGAGPGARAGLVLPLSARVALVAEAAVRAFVFRRREIGGTTRLAADPDLGLRVGLATTF